MIWLGTLWLAMMWTTLLVLVAIVVVFLLLRRRLKQLQLNLWLLPLEKGLL